MCGPCLNNFLVLFSCQFKQLMEAIFSVVQLSAMVVGKKIHTIFFLVKFKQLFTIPVTLFGLLFTNKQS